MTDTIERLRKLAQFKARLFEEYGREKSGWVKIHTDDLNAYAAMLREFAALAESVAKAPVAIMDTRVALGLCAPAEDDFPALYALQGQRVRLVREE